MAENFCTLEGMIASLCRDSRAHVCLYDAAGIFDGPLLGLPTGLRMHDVPFCDCAKDTPAGFRLCMRCKTRANCRAMNGAPFAGYCPYGLYELAQPVTVAGEVVAIIYIGNLLPDEAETQRRMRYAAERTGASVTALTAALRHAQRAASLAPYWQLAQALDSYIRLLLMQVGWKKGRGEKSGCRRKAQEAAEYIAANYNRDISLRQLAALYFVNEKYLGQVFREEMGESMHRYLGRIRLEHAARQLVAGEQPVLNIALDCGFTNISYFNRLFMERYHLSPQAFRRAARAEDAQGGIPV